MHPSVACYAREFLDRFEGTSLSMYLDRSGLVRVGVGMVIDPLSLALRLPFVHRLDRSAATEEEVTAAWQAVKQSRAPRERSSPVPPDPGDLILQSTTCERLFARRLERLTEALAYVVCEFAELQAWPADAQLALIGIGWELGPGFARRGRWPALRAACAARDFKAAAASCHIPAASVSRNHAHRHLFTNAANAIGSNKPASQLFYPAILLAPVMPDFRALRRAAPPHADTLCPSD